MKRRLEGRVQRKDETEKEERREKKSFAHATHGNYRRRGCRPLLVLPAWTFTGACLEDGVHLKERYARSDAISER